MVHQQFLHVLGVLGEHQRPDASSFISVQTDNIELTADEISQRFSSISAADWDDDMSNPARLSKIKNTKKNFRSFGICINFFLKF